MKGEVVWRRGLATLLACGLVAPSAYTQQMSTISPVKSSVPVLGWYKTPYVPAVQLSNTSRLASLIRGGKLYLTAQDAIALALENNLDVEIARYSPILDQWNLIRAQAGGSLPGVPSGSSQVGAVASGQGVSGSEAAAGVQSGNSGGSGSGSANVTISQIGPTTPALDPVLQNTTAFSHLSSPQADAVLSQVLNLVQNERNYNTSIQQGFLSGGQASLSYSESYLNENSPTDVLNPTYAPNLTLSVQHNFLSGFGVGVNSRTINVWKTNLQIDDLNFRSQVIGVVVNVLQQYYTYSADFLNVGARQRAVDVANEFLANNRKQVQIGTLAPLDVTSAEASAATSQTDLVIAQTTQQQDELALKSLLSRTGVAEPLLQAVQIVPLDHIDVPDTDDLPPFNQLVEQAKTNRVDIAAERMNMHVSELNALGTASAVRPQLAGFVSLSNAGLAGASKPVVVAASPGELQQVQASTNYPPGYGACPSSYHTNLPCELPAANLVGGVGTAAGQIFHRDYPSESGGVYFGATLRNRSNQADYAIDQLTMRQTQLQDAKDLNQLAVDVSNQVTALRQARAQYKAALQNRLLQEKLLDAEQKRFKLGASTPYNVVSQQSALALADYNVTSAMVAYSNARIGLNQSLGATLKANGVSLEEAKNGRVPRTSQLPSQLPE